MSKKQRRVPKPAIYGRIRISREDIERSKNAPGAWANLSRSQKAWWASTREEPMPKPKREEFDGGTIQYPVEYEAKWDDGALDVSPLEQIFREPVYYDQNSRAYRTASGMMFTRAEIASARENPAAFVAMVNAKREERRMGNTSNTWDRFLREGAQQKQREQERLYEAQRLVLPAGAETRLILDEIRRFEDDTNRRIENIYQGLKRQISALEAKMNAIGQMLEDGYRPRAADPKRPGGRLYRKD